ncbi:hypothetical protein J2Y63_003729 [Shinella sp. BE166]|uniref:hypothetical protein n=1 Tax=Shinella sp. BE166 TaxID=3373918 RepID=UPI003EB7B973
MAAEITQDQLFEAMEGIQTEFPYITFAVQGRHSGQILGFDLAPKQVIILQSVVDVDAQLEITAHDSRGSRVGLLYLKRSPDARRNTVETSRDSGVFNDMAWGKAG